MVAALTTNFSQADDVELPGHSSKVGLLRQWLTAVTQSMPAGVQQACLPAMQVVALDWNCSGDYLAAGEAACFCTALTKSYDFPFFALSLTSAGCYSVTTV